MTSETLEAFQQMAEVLGKSLAATIALWLEDTTDAVQLASRTMAKLRTDPARAIREMHTFSGELQIQLEEARQEVEAKMKPQRTVEAGGEVAR